MEPIFFVKVENTPTASEPFNTLEEAVKYFDATVLGWADEEYRPTVTLSESEDGGKTWTALTEKKGNLDQNPNSLIHKSHLN